MHNSKYDFKKSSFTQTWETPKLHIVAICNFIGITKTQTSIFQKITQIQYNKSDKLAELEKGNTHKYIVREHVILGKSQNANIDMLIFRDVRKPPNFHNLRFFEIAIYENHTDDVSNISNHTNRKVEGAFQCCQPDSSWHFLSDGSLHERRRNIERRLPLYDRFRYQNVDSGTTFGTPLWKLGGCTPA